MNRPLCFLATALLIASPAVAHAQVSVEELVKAHRKTSGKPASSIANDLSDWTSYTRAGWRAINKGYYDTAEHEFYSAIKTARRPTLDDPRLTARSYADYAWAIQKQGRHVEAEPLLKWALVAREAVLEPNSTYIIQNLNQLATLYYEIGRLSEAEPLLSRAVEIQGKDLRPSAQEYSRSQTLMGLVLIAQRRYAQAEPFFLKSIQLRESTLGPLHPETGDCLNNLAWTYHEQGKDDQARPLFERALKILEQSRATSDPSIAHTLDGLAQIQVIAGEFQEAEARFLRAIAIWDQSSPTGNTSLLEVLRHYADLLEKLGRAADLVKIKARITPLRARFTMAEGKLGPWYRNPGHSESPETGTALKRS